MGCGEEYPAASGKTPGWEITSKDLIIEDLRGFKKLSLREIIHVCFKCHYIAYKHGEKIVMYQL
jgi:hypothetical protein